MLYLLLREKHVNFLIQVEIAIPFKFRELSSVQKVNIVNMIAFLQFAAFYITYAFFSD